jgi:DNA-binding transcriptional LysR family regulator
MELLQFEHFLAVAEEGNFTRAAERVCRTQPAVSQSIKKLEEAIGAPLFTRDVHEVVLTEAGRTLLDYARRMVRLRDDAVRRLAEQRNLGSGTLSIVAHESAAVYLLPGPLRRYFEEFPQIKVGIYRSRLDEIPRQVMDREVDIGFVKEEPAFHELQSLLVHRDEMILIASPRHPLVSRERVSVRDLGAESFVLHHLCSSTEQKIMRLFEAHGTRCRIAAELWSFENVKQFVRQDVGLAIVPRVSVAQELAADALVEVPVEGLHMPRETYMVFRDRTSLSPPARQFIDVVDGFEWGSWFSWEPEAGAAGARPAAAPEPRRARVSVPGADAPRPPKPSLARRR